MSNCLIECSSCAVLRCEIDDLLDRWGVDYIRNYQPPGYPVDSFDYYFPSRTLLLDISMHNSAEGEGDQVRGPDDKHFRKSAWTKRNGYDYAQLKQEDLKEYEIWTYLFLLLREQLEPPLLALTH